MATNDEGPTWTVETCEGLSLRDHFAAAALMGILGVPDLHNTSEDPDDVALAKAAYVLADAMLAERDKQGSDTD